MRIPAFLLLAFSSLLFAGDAVAQSRCKDGTTATITGTIASIEQVQPQPNVNIWILKSNGKLSGNCLVEQVWGNGKAPAACTAGKKFSATGMALDADSFWMLQTEKLSCD